MSVNWSLPFDEKILPEDKRKLLSKDEYDKVHKTSVANYQQFWAGIASELEWFKPWTKILDDSNPPYYKWFTGGELNASYLCLDRHVQTWRRNKVAIIWEGEPIDQDVPKQIRKLTYNDLFEQVNRVAHILREKFGVKKGDT